ncbi:MAG: HD domain-containing protein [Firmicutes bacterium]|nr:HD domain-containing protein [Bacillota bacterium]
MANQIKNVCDFYAITHRLKTLPRTGWIDCGIQSDRIESVAEHIYGTQMLALAINAEFDLGFDISKVALMIAIHELGECIIGDIPATGSVVTKQEKQRIELEAVKKILGGLVNGSEIKKIYKEYDEQKTKEARFAYLVDKLECDLQCKYYDESGAMKFDKLTPSDIQRIRIEKWKDRGYKRFSDFWIGNDIERVFEDEPLFKSIAEYIMKHDVFK